VIGRSGSVAAPAGSRLLVREDGSIAGTVGGGALEGEVMADARTAIEAEMPLVREFDFTGDTAGENLQICGGKVTIFTEIIFPTCFERELAEKLLHEINNNRSVALVSEVSESYGSLPPSGHRMAFNRSGILAGSLTGKDLNELVAARAIALFDNPDPLLLTGEESGGQRSFLVDYLHPEPVLVVFGGGHIGRPLAHLGALTGFRVVIVDDRPEFAAPERFPDAEWTFCGDYGEMFDKIGIGPSHYLVSVTRCHTTDRLVIKKAAVSDAAYIGMIGSRRKVSLLWKELQEEGITREQLERVHAPVGISIEAETPAEIAVSIIAQIISCRRGRRPVIHTAKFTLAGAGQ
jgi:xanthine dehydrogenase accessory factor